ncbi:hypothetical protein J6590_018224 [Homalodisca vitripennis]|nr:hypothetical protein J6590_018224 [Homalodisca vitripennis]
MISPHGARQGLELGQVLIPLALTTRSLPNQTVSSGGAAAMVKNAVYDLRLDPLQQSSRTCSALKIPRSYKTFPPGSLFKHRSPTEVTILELIKETELFTFQCFLSNKPSSDTPKPQQSGEQLVECPRSSECYPDLFQRWPGSGGVI